MSDLVHQQTAQWRPSASIDTLRKRAEIIASVRQFFHQRKVMEVETPCLSRHTITDPYLNALSSLHTEPGAKNSTQLYLQTSPEYAMKRLLAAGSGDIFQINKAFRDDEVGRYHNPEFTMLEWYRLGFGMQDLIDETGELLLNSLNLQTQVCLGIEQFTYSALFERYCHFNPLDIAYKDLVEKAHIAGLKAYSEATIQAINTHNQCAETESLNSKKGEANAVNLNAQQLHADALLQALFNQQIEPNIGQNKAVVVTHFPAAQASLATLSNDGLTANRFEVYFKGIELANGFNELQDAKQQAKRFALDNEKRLSLGLVAMPVDSNFLAALEAGLPACSGIALGIDRLLMLALNKSHISEVMSFSYRHC